LRCYQESNDRILIAGLSGPHEASRPAGFFSSKTRHNLA
jgi:hypothetical protein